jgi:hypothetical protein
MSNVKATNAKLLYLHRPCPIIRSGTPVATLTKSLAGYRILLLLSNPIIALDIELGLRQAGVTDVTFHPASPECSSIAGYKFDVAITDEYLDSDSSSALSARLGVLGASCVLLVDSTSQATNLARVQPATILETPIDLSQLAAIICHAPRVNHQHD